MGNGDNFGVELRDGVEVFLQLNQLLCTERSPMGAIGRDDDVALTEPIAEI